MLKISSWLSQSVSRLRRVGTLRRLIAATVAALAITDASAQTIQLTASAYSVNENDGKITVAARRFGATNLTSTVRITAVGTGNATTGAVDGQDFIARSSTLTFPTNATEAFFEIVILDNDATNTTKFINVTLSNPTGATVVEPDSATIQIIDDETGIAGFASGSFEFSASTYTVTDYEGVTRAANALSYPGANITVVRKGGTRGRAQVDIETSGGTAYPDVLYTPIKTTLVFEDYEMSKSIVVPIHQYVEFPFDLNSNDCWRTNDTGGATNICDPTAPAPARPWPFIPVLAGDDQCFYYLFFDAVFTNRLVGGGSPTWDVNLILSNPRLDPGEDQSLPQPTLGAQSTAGLGIVFVDAIKTPDGAVLYQNIGYSFERAQYRAAEGGTGSPTGRGISFYQMWINRDICPEEALVRYRVNNDNSTSPEGDHLFRTFRLEAGSDYAHPFADYLPPASREWNIAMGLEPNSNEDAVVRWGRTELGPKPLTVPIISDDRVEFDEDLLVQLYHRQGDPGFIAGSAAAPYGYNGYPRRAKLTIEFDDIRFINNDNIFHYAYDTNGVFGAEQPAGAGDRRFNRHSANDIDPPFNQLPGANASVLAVAVAPDGKLYLGGEFESINSRKQPWVNHFGRTTRDGQVDTNFIVGSGANQAVTAIELQDDGKVIIGGLFSSYNGQLRNGLARVDANGGLDNTFNPGLGANAPVRAVKLLPGGKVLIGGEFTSFNGTNVNYLARLNSDGSLDTSFNPGGTGPDGFVYSIDVSGEPISIDLNSLEVGQRRERSDTYDAGANQGTVLIDYDFANTADRIRVYYNGVVIADSQLVVGQGSLTANFGPGPVNTTLISVVVNEGDPGLFLNAASWSYRLTIQPVLDSNPVIGGLFNTYNGVSRNRVARLMPDGQLDTQFNPGTGIQSGVVFSVAKHGNKPVLGGVFSEINELRRNNIAQLNPDGTVDTYFDPGQGFNDIVFSVIIQPTGKPVAGGLFTEFNTSRRIAMARLNHDGKLDTTFMDTAYNQFAGLPRRYTWEPENSVNAMANLRITNSYTASIIFTNTDNVVTNFDRVFTRIEDQLFIGGSFKEIGGGYTREDKLPRNNFARVWGGSTPGPGTVGLLSDQYTVDEDAGFVFIIANRDNGDLSPASAPYFTSDIPQGSGAATDLVDYLASSGSVLWPTARVTGPNFSRQLTEAYRGPNSQEFFVTDQHPGNGLNGTNDMAAALRSDLLVFVLDDNIQEGDEQLDVNIRANQMLTLLGGVPIPTWPALGRSSARLTIVDNDRSPGVIGFEKMQYFTDENVRKARITLTRTNGSAGSVTVNVRTRPGSSAEAGVDFNQINILTVLFAAGQTNAYFDVDIIDDTLAEVDETINLGLSNPTGGATLGLGQATLTIIDNDFAAGRVQFIAATNIVEEGAGFATIVVRRTGGSTGTSQVTLSTVDQTAQAGIDYAPTNVVLRWTSGDTADKIITIPIYDRAAIESANLTFGIVLSNPTVNGVPEQNALGNQKQIVVEINNNDAFGNLRFSQTGYVVDENGTNAIVTVIRVNGVSGELAVNYQATPGSALATTDFTPVSGTLTFTNNQTSASFIVPIVDDAIVDGTKTVELSLANQINTQNGSSSPGVLTFPFTNVVLSIVDNELENIPAGSLDVTFLAEGANDFVYSVALQDDGRLLIGGDFTTVNSVFRDRLARLMPDGTIDQTFFASASPNDSVRAVRLQQDGRILIAGNFQQVGTTPRNYIARLNKDGGMDLTFDPGAGANNPIYSMIVDGDKILIGGDFSAYGPTPRNGLARLNANGTLDTTFNPGTGAGGTGRFTVFAIARDLNGKYLVGGDFETFNNVPARRIVRLNKDGSVDTTFNTSLGAEGSVRSIAVQPDGNILVGGIFTSMQGVAANRIARLDSTGKIDPMFNANATVEAARRGANGPVLAIAVQNDNKIVLGGDFNEYNGVTRRGITRLNPNGSNDATINFGSGVNGSVASLAVQPDRRIILAGGFTEYDGQPRLRVARIHGGSLAGNGRFEFVRSTYTASENGTNVTITVRRVGGTSGSVSMNYSTAPDPSVPAESSAIAGTDYTATSGTLVFPEGETQATFKVQILNDTLVENEEVFIVALADQPGQPFRLGDQPNARVIIVSDDSEIFFTAPSYSVGESIPSAAASVTIGRIGSVSVPATIDFRTSNGSATAGSDYTGQTNTITFGVGESQRTINIGIAPDLLVEGNESVNLTLSNPSPGAIIRPGAGSAQLTIVDDDTAPGEIALQRTTYSVREGNTLAQVAVIRTNGLSGTVTIQYETTAGTASPGQDYENKVGVITFNDGESLKFIEVPISDDELVENNETINVRLFSPGGRATLGLDNGVLTIVDDDLGSGSLDTGFNPGVGASGPIRDIEYDGREHYLIGGDFIAFNNDASRSRIARLNLNGSIDTSFSTNNRPNNGGAVYALALQPDGRIIMGGSFNTVQGQLQNRVARLLAEGALDASFPVTLGLNAQVTDLAIQADKKVVIAGWFTVADAAQYRRIARLHENGNVDVSFDPGSGADHNINAVALDSQNRILIGGQFGTVNGIGAGRIARLNADGSVDISFRTGTGFNRADGRPAIVYDILVLSNGRVLVVGDFTSYNGVPRAGVAMLDQNGILQSFGSGLQSVNGAIRTVAVQRTDRNNDEKFFIGGDFTAVDGTPRARLARLDSSGRFDPSFDPGDGANDSVLGIFVQPWDGRVVVVGAFTEFNNNPNFRGIARLNNDKAFLPPAATTIQLAMPTMTASGGLRITFDGQQGTTYVIEGTTDFRTWTAERTVTGAGANTTTEIAPTTQNRFFRVRRQ